MTICGVVLPQMRRVYGGSHKAQFQEASKSWREAMKDQASKNRKEGKTSQAKRGSPGRSEGRVDEVKGSGVYPASGPLPPGDAVIRGQAEWGQGSRGAAGAQDHGESETMTLPPEFGTAKKTVEDREVKQQRPTREPDSSRVQFDLTVEQAELLRDCLFTQADQSAGQRNEILALHEQVVGALNEVSRRPSGVGGKAR